MRWAECDQLLGTMADTDLARKMKCSAKTIARRRQAKGIPTYTKHSGDRSNWGIDWSGYDPLLGTMPDTELAEKIGCSAGAVSSRRNKLRIQKFSKGTKRRRRMAAKKKIINWPEWDFLLGAMTDKDLAARVGCSAQAVRSRRIELGIDPFT